jgi:hypothetical protein
MAMDRYRGPAQRSTVQRAPTSSSLADVLNVILDKGIVIDAWARISVVGIEILTIEARVVIASVETYLRYAEAIGTTALAAAPAEERGNRYQQNGSSNNTQNGNGRHLPSPDEVAGYLSDHPEGTRLGDLQAYFDAPRQELSDTLDQLVDENRAQMDQQRRVYLPAGQNAQLNQGGQG